MSIIIIGGDSGIGQFTARKFREQGVDVLTTTRNKAQVNSHNLYFDLDDDSCIWEILESNVSSAIICAAITSIQFCEENPEKSHRINYVKTVELMKRFLIKDIHLTFLSTSLVFDGALQLQKDESGLKPKNNYGFQKLLAENELINSGSSNYAILRLSKVLGKKFDLFERWINLLKTGKPIYPFEDMFFSPISSDLVFRVINKINKSKGVGIYQLSSCTEISYLQAATYIAQSLHLDKDLVVGVTANSVGQFSKSFISTMDTDKVEHLMNEKVPNSYAAIDYFLAQQKY